jgi:hypothetical protein
MKGYLRSIENVTAVKAGLARRGLGTTIRPDLPILSFISIIVPHAINCGHSGTSLPVFAESRLTLRNKPTVVGSSSGEQTETAKVVLRPMGLLLNNAFQRADAKRIRRTMEGKRDAASIRAGGKVSGFPFGVGG